MKKILFIIIFVLSISFVYGDEDINDLSDQKKIDGIQIEKCEPDYVPIRLSTINNITLIGDNLKYVDLDSIGIFKKGTSKPCFEIIHAYPSLDNIDIAYRDSNNTAITLEDIYEIRFKKLGGNKWFSYPISVKNQAIINIIGEMIESKKQFLHVYFENSHLLEDDIVFNLHDGEGKIVAKGTHDFVLGHSGLIFDLDFVPQKGQRYTITCDEPNVKVDYSKYLYHEYINVYQQPSVIMDDQGIVNYSKYHLTEYILDLYGYNLQPDLYHTITLKAYEPLEVGDYVTDSNTHTIKNILNDKSVTVEHNVDENQIEKLRIIIDKELLKPLDYFVFFGHDNRNKNNHTCLSASFEYILNYAKDKPAKAIEYNHTWQSFDNILALKSTDEPLDLRVEVKVDAWRDSIEGQTFFNSTYSDTFTQEIISPEYDITSIDYEYNMPFEIGFNKKHLNLNNYTNYTVYSFNALFNEWQPLDTIEDDSYLKTTVDHGGYYFLVATTKKFKDIKGHWAEAYILELANKDGISGQDGYFMPEDSISKAEFITMVVNNLNIEASEISLPFEDITNQWFKPYIQSAYDYGLISASEEFNPNEPITRLEIVKILSEAIKINMPLPVYHDALLFEDCDELTDEEVVQVRLLNKLKIMNGLSGSSFGPNLSATRAETAVIMTKIKDLLN